MEKGTGNVSIARIAVIVLVGIGLGCLVYFSPAYFIAPEKMSPSLQLRTGGTSSAAMILENRWASRYRKDKVVQVDYDSSGSTKGVNNMIDQFYQIGFVHAPLTEEQLKKAKAKGGEVLHIPVVLCAVVPAYNLKELKDKPPLNFTADVLADIYLGKITKWNDPAIKKINEGVALPDVKIIPVHREDSSGTTYIFADYLQGASEAWKAAMGEAKSELKWPAGVGEGKTRSFGVARFVEETEGARLRRSAPCLQTRIRKQGKNRRRRSAHLRSCPK